MKKILLCLIIGIFACWSFTPVVAGSSEVYRDKIKYNEARVKQIKQAEAEKVKNIKAALIWVKKVVSYIEALSRSQKNNPNIKYWNGYKCWQGCVQRELPCVHGEWLCARESTSGHIDIQNPSSSACGKYQFIAGTWQKFMGYVNACLAPEWVQDAKARSIPVCHWSPPNYCG